MMEIWFQIFTFTDQLEDCQQKTASLQVECKNTDDE